MHYCHYTAIITSVIALAFLSIIFNDAFHLINQEEQATDRLLISSFNAYTLKYHKAYLTQQERKMRFEIYAQNYQLISQSNQQHNTFKLALNKYADLTEEEYKTLYLMPPEPTGYEYYEENNKPLPAGDDVQIDYTSMIGRVKDQGSCGSCWAFATTGVLEHLHSINTGKVLEFSEQLLVDCCNTTSGCNGGGPGRSFTCSLTLGAVLETDYPYIAEKDKCQIEKPIIFKPAGFSHTISANDTDLLNRLKIQSLNLGVNAASYFWRFYESGIVTRGCSWTEVNHNVLLVGAGTDQGTGLPYWKIKNSWGPNWGANGYIYILRENNENKPAQCAMNLANYYALYGKISS